MGVIMQLSRCNAAICITYLLFIKAFKSAKDAYHEPKQAVEGSFMTYNYDLFVMGADSADVRAARKNLSLSATRKMVNVELR